MGRRNEPIPDQSVERLNNAVVGLAGQPGEFALEEGALRTQRHDSPDGFDSLRQ
jgi:hypothetical protein